MGQLSAASKAAIVERLKVEGKLIPVGRKKTITPARRVVLEGTDADSQRVRLEVADGGVVFLDCNLEKRESSPVSVSFIGILDASQIKGKVGRVVNCRIEDGAGTAEASAL